MKIVSRKPADAPPARLAALDRLPVFLDLCGKRVIVAGGGDAAAWKAELLAACGARVEVHAAEIGEEMAALLQRGATRGELVHIAHDWDAGIFAGASVAVGDCAQRAGVAANIIDRPAFGQFQFGTIVNRSPIVVGISTGGASPMLGQAIRCRIEALLPPWLSRWGLLAREFRASVMSRLQPARLRRDFCRRDRSRIRPCEGPRDPGRRRSRRCRAADAEGSPCAAGGRCHSVR
jgi:uroporphyrin-III C-methyltransferase/precorrin-2 dehydrogenase/sirohydrochlorin ferrochelatase